MSLTRYWVENERTLHEGPTFANIAYPDEAVAVVKLADVRALVESAAKHYGHRGHYERAAALFELLAALKEEP